MLNSNELEPALARDSRLMSYTIILLSAPAYAYSHIETFQLTVAIRSIASDSEELSPPAFT